MLEAFFSERGVPAEALYPMTRGRVFSVNQEALPEWREVESEDTLVNAKPISPGLTHCRRAIFWWREIGGAP